MLAQLLTNWNNNDTRSNHNEEEHNDDEQPKTEKSKESFSINAKVFKGIQVQIASLAQRDELKKAGMTRPYPLEWDLVPYPPSLSHLCYIRIMVKAHQTSISITFDPRLEMS